MLPGLKPNQTMSDEELMAQIPVIVRISTALRSAPSEIPLSYSPPPVHEFISDLILIDMFPAARGEHYGQDRDGFLHVLPLEVSGDARTSTQGDLSPRDAFLLVRLFEIYVQN